MIGNDWDNVLNKMFSSDMFKTFMNNVKGLYDKYACYPEYDNIFNALKLTPYKDVKVVIIGQDPYHGEGEAHGLSFSVREGVKVPPSLKNIYKEINDDLGIEIPNTGDLTPWAKQGVLLLNAVLTVFEDKPASHKPIGWEVYTDHIIKKINEKEEPVVFILWGAFAKKKKELITNNKHFIIESTHPSPFSARYGFFGSKPFSKANEFLRNNNLKEIDWSI